MGPDGSAGEQWRLTLITSRKNVDTDNSVLLRKGVGIAL